MKGIGAGSRVFGLLEREPLIPYASGVPFPKPNPAAGDHMGTIRFEKVSFNYPSRPKVAVLKDFNLELKSGESVALVYVARLPQIHSYCDFLRADLLLLNRRVGVD